MTIKQQLRDRLREAEMLRDLAARCGDPVRAAQLRAEARALELKAADIFIANWKEILK